MTHGLIEVRTTLAGLLLVALSITVAGCMIAAPGAMSAFAAGSLVGTRWVLDQAPVQTQAGRPVQTQAETPAPPVPTLQFTDATRANGTGGCNSFAGKVVLSGDALRLGPLAATRRMCITPVMQSEDRYFRQLEAVRRARIEDGRLVLLDEAGVALVRLVPAK